MKLCYTEPRKPVFGDRVRTKNIMVRKFIDMTHMDSNQFVIPGPFFYEWKPEPDVREGFLIGTRTLPEGEWKPRYGENEGYLKISRTKLVALVVFHPRKAPKYFELESLEVL